MTGFASVDAASPPFRLVWELRSVNHRFLDLSLRLPEELRALEPECRELVSNTVRRGKLECILKVASEKQARGYRLAADALEELKSLQRALGAEFPDAKPLSMNDVLRWPGVLAEPELDFAALAEPVKAALREAVVVLQEARRREGERLAGLVARRNEAILAALHELRPRLGALEQGYRLKLEERLARLAVQADPQRVEQELVLVAQRLDVSEEVERLAGHVAEVAAVLERDEPIGRRLDFLIQEMNREANTLGSKSQDEDLTRTAVELKVLIEQMREQVQNLE
ncbi:MAG TPA: YicC/YloC family endoribonuclease [Gammaproteobacteria bacterium]|nr:YicC/YloC family endoribonuclease [Gammaproteobacteria bacterium]